MELSTEYKINNSKSICTGLYRGIPTISFTSKKNVLFISKEEWTFITCQSSKISSYFSKRKKDQKEETFSLNNITFTCTTRGRNRVVQFDNAYPWFTTINYTPSPHLSLSSPSIIFNKGDFVKLCSMKDNINKSLLLLDKIEKIYCNHVKSNDDNDPLDLSTNTLFKYLCKDALL